MYSVCVTGQNRIQPCATIHKHKTEIKGKRVLLTECPIWGEGGLPCSKPFSSAKHRNPLAPKETEIHIHAQRWVSISPAPGSLSEAHTCEASISMALPQLSPSPRTRVHCQITAAGHVKGLVLWALASRAA